MSQFQPSKYSNYGAEESWYSKYAEMAPRWSPVGLMHEDEEEKAIREAAEAEAAKAAPQSQPRTQTQPQTQPQPQTQDDGKKPQITEQPWFWPAVITGVFGIIGGVIWFWPKGKPIPLIGKKN